MSDLQKSLRIRESLLPPMSDVIKRLGPGAVAASYIQLLDAAYDTVEDGDELMARFINTLQDSGEKTSTYLHRLQAVLNQAVRRGGVATGEADRHLLKQLCRGCWDNALLLKLEPLKDAPPSFVDLLLLLRGEEDKEASRAVRMKQHLGSARTQEKGVCKPSSHGYQAVMKILEARQKHTDTGALGWAKMQGSNPEVIPAGHTVVVDAFIHVNGAITESFQSEGEHGLPEIPHMTEKELREATAS
ncbi:hypothetical protein AAFF_G00419290 [Aldrovandia affinis]|uniref:Paraneoplastic antigen Ma-like C-terminal domain-containing protein n=1 Tax=Aldrovandia affinis TaxID=143900 RepID=A0AAD7S9Y8_9TELE|nr:hypothetical protein AAFF_G00419290 [Aldrovandia affinis]